MNALPNECGYLHARRVEDTLKNFIASSDTTVQAKHVPRTNRVIVEVSLSEGSDVVQSIFGTHGADVTYLNSDKHIQVSSVQCSVLAFIILVILSVGEFFILIT